MRGIAFYILATLSCIFGLLAVTRKNPVHSALMLVLSLLSLAGVYIAVGAVFLAMAQVFVYAGAIMVLFLFVIMLVGTQEDEIRRRYRFGAAWGAVIAVLFFMVFLAKMPVIPGTEQIWVYQVGAEALARPLIGAAGEWGTHALAFELSSVLVLASIIGAVLLSRRRQ